MKHFLPYLFLLLCQTLLAQSFNFINYSVREGLPQSQVYATCQDSRGYMWFGTQGGGLSRYDGFTFQNYTAGDGLASNYIQALSETPDRRIIAGTSKGVSVLNGEHFETWMFRDSNDHFITAILPGIKGGYWIGTADGLYFSEGPGKPIDSWKKEALLNETYINTLFKDTYGLWVGTNKGLWLIGDRVTRLSPQQGLSGSDVQFITRDDKGLLWLAIFQGGVNVLDPVRLRVVKKYIRPDIEKALCLHIDPDQKVWVGTENRGISIFNPANTTWESISESDRLPNNHVRSILRDVWGNTWISTSGGGVVKQIQQNFTHYDTDKGLNGNRIYALSEDKTGKIWMSVGSNGITSFDQYQFRPFAGDSLLSGAKSKSVVADTTGRIWIGTEEYGIAYIDSSGTHWLNKNNGLPGNAIRNLAAATDGKIWAATWDRGICSIQQQDSTWLIRNYTKANGLPSLLITYIKTDTKGRIWFCTRHGQVGYIENDKVKKVFNQKNKLPELPIRSITFDKKGNPWIGSAGEGIWFADLNADPVEFRQLDTPGAAYSNNIYLLIFDPEGNLWAGSESGVDKFVFKKENLPAEVQHYGKNEGFLGIETCQNAVLADQRGHLWFGTMNGLIRHTPGASQQQTQPPLLSFENIALFYKPLASTPFARFALPQGGLAPGLELPYHQNHLSFSFKAIHLNSPGRVLYHWKLEAAESEWSPWSTEQSVNYANLAPGTYRFLVAATADGKTITTPLTVGFTILQPFWQTLKFRILMGSLLLGCITLLFFGRLRQIRKQEAALREQLEVRNKILQLEQKSLQLQMNPHFIFNTLNSIQSLVSEKDFLTARSEINHFAALMRSILSNSRKQYITLEEEIETLRKYLRIEQFCQKNPFEFTIESTAINTEEIDLPPMLLQPFVENAVIHGLAHLTTPGLLRIEFSLQGELLTCIITDNGVGRQKAKELRQLQSPGHTSTAMEVTSERLEVLCAGLNVEPLVFEDLLDEKGVAAGTRVTVRVPVVDKLG